MRLGSYHRVLSLVQNMQTLGQFFKPLYMLVLNLPILSRAGIAEIKDMMRLHGSGRMEEKHRTCVMCMCCGSIAMHSTEMNCQG